MTIWTAIRRHWVLVVVGAAAGVMLAFLTVFTVGTGLDGNPQITLKPLDTYVTSLSAVIDTSAFGLGSSDTDVDRLANLAPTYAELLASEPVLRAAETRLGGQVAIRRADTGATDEDGAQVSAEAVLESPILKLSVEAQERAVTIDVAVAVMTAFQEYLAASQAKNATPVEKRLSIMVVGEPSRPILASNRRREIALLLFCLPIAVAVVIAYRLERPAVGVPGQGAPSVQSPDVAQPVAVKAAE